MIEINHPNDFLSIFITKIRSEEFLTISERYNMNADFTPNTLKDVEKGLRQAASEMGDLRSFSILFGVYVGETIIQTLGQGAEWLLYHSSKPEFTTLRLNNGNGETLLQPILAVKKFLENGDSLYSYAKSNIAVFRMTIPAIQERTKGLIEEESLYLTKILSEEESLSLKNGSLWEEFSREHTRRFH